MPGVEALFLTAALLVLYPYIGYPAALRAISLFRTRKQAGENKAGKPRVTLIISAYNEEKVIEDKISNSLALDYPGDRMEIMVVSDGSTDSTADIVMKYAKRGVVLKHYAERSGKTACLNRAVPEAKGEIVIFSDANSNYEKDAIKTLVRHFASPEIGFVTGRTAYASEDGGVAGTVGFYSMLEKLTKKLESKIGSCVGADGAIFAIRKGLYRPLRASDINDLVIPLKIVAQGYRGVLEEKAVCIEKTAGTGKGEFNRQVRITARTLKAISGNAGLLNPLSYGLFSFELFSHKVLRLLAPFFLIILFASNILLLSKGLFYKAAFIAQAVFYVCALFENRGRGFSAVRKIFSLAYTFSAVNAAIFWGWVKFIKGESFVTWSPTKR